MTRNKYDIIGAWSNLDAQKTFEKLSDLLPRAAESRCGVFLRPLSSRRVNDPIMICVDDADTEVMAKIRPFAFLILEVSPQRYQCWLAVDTGNWPRAAALRKLSQSESAEVSAPLAGTTAGTDGFRETNTGERRVKLFEAVVGRVVSIRQLERNGVAPYLSAACLV